MKDHINIEAPAKINLTLRVVSKRSDGFHALETVMQQVDLCDQISITVAAAGLEVRSNNNDVPVDGANLAYRAARLFCEKMGLQKGLRIAIDKKIPIGAGLGGGSTDAAAVLLGLNDMMDGRMDLDTLLELGLHVGSDVPFCILGGTALAQGRGEILDPLPPGPHLELVLVKPPLQLSTAEVYAALRLDQLNEQPDIRVFLEAWNRCDIIGLVPHMKNDLETASIDMCPEVARIKGRLGSLGALHTLMSGSGPSVIGVFEDHQAAMDAWRSIKDEYQESFQVSPYTKKRWYD